MANLVVADMMNGAAVNNKWEGSAIFDKLVMAVDDNLNIQYKNKRIIGTDYATAYVALLDTVIKSSIQYTLQEKKTEADIAAVEAGVANENRLTDANIIKITKDGILVDKQGDKLVDDLVTAARQREVMNAQILKIGKENALSDKQRDKITDSFITSAREREVMNAQILKISKENVLLDKQGNKLTDDLTTSSRQREVMNAQILKIGKENALLDKQGDKITDSFVTATRQREVMASQILLYNRQRESFDDNKDQKLLEAQLNYNGIVFQDADNPDVLNVALETAVTATYNRIIS